MRGNDEVMGHASDIFAKRMEAGSAWRPAVLHSLMLLNISIIATIVIVGMVLMPGVLLMSGIMSFTNFQRHPSYA